MIPKAIIDGTLTAISVNRLALFCRASTGYRTMFHRQRIVGQRLASGLAKFFISVSVVAFFPVTADPLVSPFQLPDAPSAEPSILVDTLKARPSPEMGAAKANPIDTLMRSIVSITATIPDDARTALNLGTKRLGSGVVLDTNGLIVTAGYTIAEANAVTVTFSDDRTEPADIVAYDEATGLGLVRVNSSFITTPITLGKSSSVKKDQHLMVIPAAGEPDARGVRVGKVENFTGGWEYMVEGAIHTYPPSTSFAGAALVSEKAELLGIGSLVTIDIDIDPKIRVPGNVFVPIDSLTRVLGELIISGRSQESRKPWLGLDTKQTKNGIMVSSVIADGPADMAGIKAGDKIVAVNQDKVDGQADMYEKIWSSHKPGDAVHLLVIRENRYNNVPVDSIDYYNWLQLDTAGDTVISEMTE